MSDCWSTNDKLFVDAKLEVLWFDLSFASSPSQPLPVERRSGVVYDGPKGDNFKVYLCKMGFRVNNKGRVIVTTAQQDNDTAEAFRHFLLDKVVPLGPFGFQNRPIPRCQEVKELQNLMDSKSAQAREIFQELELWINETIRPEEDNSSVESLTAYLEAPLIDGASRNSCNPGHVKFSLSRSTKMGTNFLEFMHRMNRTFVNRAGKYLKFEFNCTNFSGNQLIMDNIFRYYDRNCHLIRVFTMVQFDATEPANALVERQVSLPEIAPDDTSVLDDTTRVIEQNLGDFSAFTWNDFCFIGKITEAPDETFRENALVTVFFEQSNHGDNCYVDCLATTFFVLAGQSRKWENVNQVAPTFV